jgi:HSP20 family protein
MELSDDIRALFDDLDAALGSRRRVLSGDCRPAVDVRETDARVEVIVEVCGVPASALRVLFRAGAVVIAGDKAPSPPVAGQTFHLVEREFGRFARVVHVTGAFDVPNVHALVRDGELRIVLPKLAERRGRPHHIPVTSAGP